MNLPPLRGMLHKKHQHQRPLMNWGRRYFEVDDERGILYYFKTRAAAVFEEEPARHFRLSTLLSARALELAGPLSNALPHAMEIVRVHHVHSTGKS